MAVASVAISVPKPFSSGDAAEWFLRFDICSAANDWKDELKAVKLPTLLEGEALAAWLDLEEDDRKEYKTVRKLLVEALMPIGFTLLDKFHRLLPGESLSLFSHELKKLLEHAMPEIDQKTRDQLLLHQFVAGLPVQVSKQLRAVGATTELKSTVQRAKLLMSLEKQQPVAAITPTDPKRTLAEGTMNEKFDRLTEQVAALSAQVQQSRFANQRQQRYGQRYEQREPPRCFNCGRRGHIARNCFQTRGNSNGVPAQGNRHPTRE